MYPAMAVLAWLLDCSVVNAILRILSAKGVDILLCAPTRRVAKRMSEATGFEAKTIHRLLEVDPRGPAGSGEMGRTRSIAACW